MDRISRFGHVLLPIFCILLPVGQTSYAVTDAAVPATVKTLKRKAGLISERTHRKLSKIHKAIAKKNFKGALADLDRLAKSVKSKKIELAQVHQARGYVFAEQEKYIKAERAFSKALALESLPAAVTLQTMYNVAQLRMALSQHKAAEKMLIDWFQYQANPKPKAHILMATVYAELKKKDLAANQVKIASKKSKKPEERWYQFLLSIYYEQKKYKNAASVLEEMIVRYPTQDNYWRQLASVYASTNDYAKSLAISELAYKKGYLTKEGDLLNLVSLLMLREIPYRAALVLQDGLDAGLINKKKAKHWEILADCWLRAQEREKAIAALGQAAKRSNKGDILVRQAELLAEQEKWKEASSAIRKAIASGNVKNPGRAHLTLGIARYNAKDPKGALAAFRQAAKSQPTKTQAERWIQFVSEG